MDVRVLGRVVRSICCTMFAQLLRIERSRSFRVSLEPERFDDNIEVEPGERIVGQYDRGSPAAGTEHRAIRVIHPKVLGPIFSVVVVADGGFTAESKPAG